MMKFTKVACLLALCSGIAMGCGDDDDDGGEKVEACSFDDDTCQEAPGIAAFCDSLGTTVDSCPTANVLGTCVFEDEGNKTTMYYYEGDNWDADSAEEDCEDPFYDGTFTAK